MLLTLIVIVGQILSAGSMALRMGMPRREALTVGVGMCGRAEMAFILASLALAQQAIDQSMFSVLIFTCFLLNLFTPLALKGCAVLLQGRAAHLEDATRGVLQIDKFNEPLVEKQLDGRLSHTLPTVDDAVVIYGYGPEVEALLGELESRGLPVVVIEENEAVARRLQERGLRVVHASLSEEQLDLSPLARARALVANGEDENNAVLALDAREQGFNGIMIAMIDNANRRAAMQLAGVTAAFTPNHVLAAAIAARASAKIGPLVAGVEPLGSLLEVAELRIHDGNPLAGSTLSEAGIHTKTGAHIVGQWLDDELRSPPTSNQELRSGMILVAAGNPDSMRKLGELVRPITHEGPIVVIGYSEVAQKITEFLRDCGEQVCAIASEEHPGVDIVGDLMEDPVLERADIANARVAILALENDSATTLEAAIVRDKAPDVPIIASVATVENVERIQQAGADFALSISQVSGQILAHHVLGETVSHQPRMKLVKLAPGPLAGQNPRAARIREHTGCTVVAVERNGEMIMDFDDSLTLTAEDALYVCGTANAFNRYHEQFPGARL